MSGSITRTRRVALLALMALTGFGTGCAREQDTTPDPLLVLAAANLQLAFEELLPRFEAVSGEEANLVLGSSGNLATQIRSGAPADLFFSADEAFVDRLVEEGLIDADSRRVYAVGRLVLVVPPGRSPPADLRGLADPAFRLVAIANPEYAPYGVAAEEALRRSGVRDSIASRLVLGENVAQTYEFVRTGNADAGLVALASVAGASDAALPFRSVDATLHTPLQQAAGVLTGSRRREVAQALMEFVFSTEGREILTRHGFEAPE